MAKRPKQITTVTVQLVRSFDDPDEAAAYIKEQADSPHLNIIEVERYEDDDDC